MGQKTLWSPQNFFDLEKFRQHPPQCVQIVRQTVKEYQCRCVDVVRLRCADGSPFGSAAYRAAYVAHRNYRASPGNREIGNWRDARLQFVDALFEPADISVAYGLHLVLPAFSYGKQRLDAHKYRVYAVNVGDVFGVRALFSHRVA